MDEERVWKLIGQLGILLLALVAAYLVLKLAGFVQSITLEEILTTAVFGALFYVGYSYRAIEEIKELKRDFRKLDRRISKLEKR